MSELVSLPAKASTETKNATQPQTRHHLALIRLRNPTQGLRPQVSCLNMKSRNGMTGVRVQRQLYAHLIRLEYVLLFWDVFVITLTW